ncbi:MAG TPA: hypothetical protein VG324_21975, partial [Blastocatellia bacterium]|nr:hypothetical protein [Blastocatellia bacterium]
GETRAARNGPQHVENVCRCSMCRVDFHASRRFHANFIISTIALSLILTNLDLSFTGAYHSASVSLIKSEHIYVGAASMGYLAIYRPRSVIHIGDAIVAAFTLFSGGDIAHDPGRVENSSQR